MAKTKDKEREHALLSASSAHKWLHCTPSARLEDSLPDDTSDAAKEGTLAHTICELKLAKLFTDQNMTVKAFNTRHNKLKKDPFYHPEMERFTDEYVDYIKELAFAMPSLPMVALEKRLHYGVYAKEGFGTGDCVLIQGETAHIIDFKYGKGVPVSAHDNHQLKLYALGALEEYGFLYPIKSVVLHICQPRLRSFTQYEIQTQELLSWGATVVKPVADLAFEGLGDFVEGPWCDENFCRASALCRRRMDNAMEVFVQTLNPITGLPKEPATISHEEVGAILKKAQHVKKWVAKLEKYALSRLLAGNKIPDWKLVEGRSNRAFTDANDLVKALSDSGFDKALLYENKILSLTAMEDLIDKETWQTVVSKYIVKAPGKPTLVPIDDSRAELQLTASAEEAFGGDNTYKED